MFAIAKLLYTFYHVVEHCIAHAGINTNPEAVVHHEVRHPQFAYHAITFAALAHLIKSRMLLPRDPSKDEDPRKPLADALEEYRRAQLAAAELFSLAGYCHSAVWFVSDWLVSFVLGLLCTGLFALLARVTGAATARGLAGWQYWQVGVYAGFPGMLIGTAAAALELPVLSYGTAYVLALVIYWLPAAAACSTDDGVRRPPDAGGTPGK